MGMGMAVMRMAKMLVNMRMCGLARIAARCRSVSLLLHPEIFYAFETPRAAAPQSYYAV